MGGKLGQRVSPKRIFPRKLNYTFFDLPHPAIIDILEIVDYRVTYEKS